MQNQKVFFEHYVVPHDSLKMTVPVTEVTITEDRADIRRYAPFSWDNGPFTLLVDNVTPYLIDETLWAEVAAAEGSVKSEIGSVRCVRWFVTQEESARKKEKDLIANIEKLYNKLATLYHRKDSLRWRHGGFMKAMDPTLNSILEQVLFTESMPNVYSPHMENILKETAFAYREDNDIDREYKDAERELINLRNEMRADLPIVHKQAGILISLEAKSRGEGVIRCGYQVPCAQWRPQHEAQLLPDDKVRFITHGVVWQNTGEEWKDVALTLSTSKPSLGMDVPLPDEDVLSLREKSKQEKKKIRIEYRDEVVQRAGADDKGPGEPPLPADGGESQLYRVPDKVTVPSTGEPGLIQLGEVELSGKTELIAVPELDGHVFLKSLVSNPQSRPILAGPVSLLRHGTFVGMGAVDFVGSKEPFHIWWGSEDLVRIERYEQKTEEEASLLQLRKATTTVILHLRNLSGESTSFRIQERMPVSEVEQVRFKVKSLPGGATEPDKNGFVFIPVTLSPQEEKTLELSYQIEMDDKVDMA